MTVLYMILAAIVVLTPLIALHEWGHYIVARLCGVKVLTYSIGFGKKVICWTSPKTGIEYCLCAIPLGGYVRMLDESEQQVSPDQRHVAFNTQHPLKKIAIVLAGPIMNFVIAIGVFFVLFLFPSQQLSTKIGQIIPKSPAVHSSLQVGDVIVAVDDKPTLTWEEINYQLASRAGESGSVLVSVERDGSRLQQSVGITAFMQGEQKGLDPLSSLGVLPWQPKFSPIVGEIVPNSPAEMAGLKVADTIISIDDIPIDEWSVATRIIQNSPNTSLVVNVLRQGQKHTLSMTPQAVKAQGRTIGQIGAKVRHQGKIDIPPEYLRVVSYKPSQALVNSFDKTYQLAKMTVISLVRMAQGLIGIDTLSGPITIAEVSKESFEMGWQQVLSTAALISLSLAVFNLLPIPVLDGGHLVFYTYELLMGKPMPAAVSGFGMQVGIVLLACFMMVAISNDILRIFGS